MIRVSNKEVSGCFSICTLKCSTIWKENLSTRKSPKRCVNTKTKEICDHDDQARTCYNFTSNRCISKKRNGRFQTSRQTRKSALHARDTASQRRETCTKWHELEEQACKLLTRDAWNEQDSRARWFVGKHHEVTETQLVQKTKLLAPMLHLGLRKSADWLSLKSAECEPTPVFRQKKYTDRSQPVKCQVLPRIWLRPAKEYRKYMHQLHLQRRRTTSGS